VGVAFVVARPGKSIEAAALTRHLEGRLARYKLPKEFVALDALPRTPYGKVQKPALQDAYIARRAPGAGSEPREG
jgi:fatty-acyl-CoA synthase